MIDTWDPNIKIEEQEPGRVVYRRLSDGRRWAIHGTCDHRGDCLLGTVIEGEQVRDHAHIRELQERLGRDRIDSLIDVPVTPEFCGPDGDCCGQDGTLTAVELEPVEG